MWVRYHELQLDMSSIIILIGPSPTSLRAQVQDPSGQGIRREQLLLRPHRHRVLLPHNGWQVSMCASACVCVCVGIPLIQLILIHFVGYEH